MIQDPAQTAHQEALTALRNAEREVSNARYFDLARYQQARSTAAVAIATLAAAAAEHPALPELRKRFVALEPKADEIVVGAVQDALASSVRAAGRDLGRFEREREQGVGFCDPPAAVEKLSSAIKKVREVLDGARDRLTSERGQALIAEHEAWIASTEAQIAEVKLVGEVVALYVQPRLDVPRSGLLSFGNALQFIEALLRRPNRDHLAVQWDALQKLVEGFRDPRFAAVPEAQKALARFAELEAIVPAHLGSEDQIAARTALIRQRAADTAKAARPAYEVWGAQQRPIQARAATIVDQIGQYDGKWLAGAWDDLRTTFDGFTEIAGEIYRLDWDPDILAQLEAGMQRLTDLHAAVVERHEQGSQFRGTAVYDPGPTQFLCEIVGVASYTPKHEVRDAQGQLVGKVAGTPYPVPRVTLRGLASTYYVLVPGQPPSLDAMTTDGIIP